MIHAILTTAVALPAADDSGTILGIDTVWIFSFLFAIGAFVGFMFLYNTLVIARKPDEEENSALEAHADKLREGLKKASDLQAQKRRRVRLHQDETSEQIKEVLGSINALEDDQIKEVQQTMAQAGFRSKSQAFKVILGRIIFPIVFGSIAAIVVYVIEYFPDWSTTNRALVVMGAIILGYKSVDIYLSNLRTKRAEAIRDGIPDALDLLVICAEAGLTIDTALMRVSQELGRAYPELAEELTLTSIELGFLTERREAYQNLNYRVGLPEMKSITTTLLQTEKYGTPLASALRVLSAESRNTRLMRAEEKAARLPAIMTVPLIFFILPVLFVVIIGPAACNISDNFVG